MSTRARRLFLHIGLPKTGTTYLQSCVWASKPVLAERGVLVPGRRHRRHLLAALELKQAPRLTSLVGEGVRPWQELVTEVQAWEHDALITHEFLAAASTEQIARGVADVPDHEVHVILTARPVVDVFVSRWQEWVKNGNTGSIDSYPPEGARLTGDWGWSSFDLADVLERWGSVVPHERIHVVPAGSASQDPLDLLRRFTGVLGVSADGLEAPPAAANTSLGIAQVELLRRVNEHVQHELRSAKDRGRWIRGYLGETLLWAPGAERFRPGDEKVADLQRRAARAEELLAGGGFRVHGDVADLAQRDLSDRRHPGEVTAEEMLAPAILGLAEATLDVRAGEPRDRTTEPTTERTTERETTS